MPKALIKQNGLLDSWGRTNNRKYPNLICQECGETFKPIHKNSKYCSRQCAWKNNGKNMGQNIDHEIWWLDKKGYIQGRVWRNGKKINIRQHRWVMQQYLGRELQPFEDVHHKNGNKQDNRLENLELIKHGLHTIKYQKGVKKQSGRKNNLSDQERKRRSDWMHMLHQTKKLYIYK
jgi:hypothetical protein